MAKPVLHQTHPDIVNRLRRAEGHLRTIITMLEEQRGCLEPGHWEAGMKGSIVVAGN